MLPGISVSTDRDTVKPKSGMLVLSLGLGACGVLEGCLGGAWGVLGGCFGGAWEGARRVLREGPGSSRTALDPPYYSLLSSHTHDDPRGVGGYTIQDSY